ncbi:MFS transporter [Kitasatospora sp. NPDC002040]|uniref:MFS transporter n=1 Tax=Kitasatospora sp. NPDC002040 TaxID=3154661 RepID=UPI00332B9B02
MASITTNSDKRPDSPSILASFRATPVPVRYLLGGILVNQAGAFAQSFLLLYLTVNRFSVGQAGIALAVYSAGAVLGTLAGGEVTHRAGPRNTIIGAMTVSAVLISIVPWLATPALYGVLLVVVGLTGLATQAYRPASSVLLAELMPAENRVMGFAMQRTAISAGSALGPLIAAALVLVDWDLLFWVDGLTALAYAGLALIFFPAGTSTRAQERTNVPTRSAYLALLRDGRFLLFLLSMLLGALIYAQYYVALPLQITADGYPTAVYSAVLVVSSLTLILCELKVTSYTQNRPAHRVSAFGQAVFGIGLIGYALATLNVTVLFIATLLVAFGAMFSGPMMFSYPATFPDTVKARYIAAHQASFGLGLALGPVFGVAVWEALHRGVWWVCGLLGLVSAVLALVSMAPRADAAPQEDPEPREDAAPQEDAVP